MATLYDKDGNEVEALTEEEQSAFAEKAVEDFKASNPDFANVEQLKEDLATKQKELEDLKAGSDDKNKNIAGQKQTIEQKEKEIEDLKTQMGSQMKEMKDFVIGRSVSELIKKVSNGDEELTKKIRHHFDTTLSAMKAETDDEIAEKITAALKLSDAGAKAPSVFDNTAGSGGANGGNNNSNTGKPSSELVEFGQKFGVSAEDWDKYGGKK